MWTLWMIAAFASAPLDKAAEAASEGGGVWLADGALIVGNPDTPGRPGVKPLDAYASITLPADVTSWEDLSAPCDGPNEARGRAGVLRVALQAGGAIPVARVTWSQGDVVLGEASLAPGVTPCAVLVDDLDADPAEELVVVWRVDASVGVTIWEAPAGVAPATAPR